MRRPRPLTDDDRELIRLVARCHTNAEIAKRLRISPNTLRSRLAVLHRLVGTSAGLAHDSILCRVRMAAWAYENGLMDGVVRNTVPRDVPVELAAELLDVCEAIVTDRPRGDLRVLAKRALRIAGKR